MDLVLDGIDRGDTGTGQRAGGARTRRRNRARDRQRERVDLVSRGRGRILLRFGPEFDAAAGQRGVIDGGQDLVFNRVQRNRHADRSGKDRAGPRRGGDGHRNGARVCSDLRAVGGVQTGLARGRGDRAAGDGGRDGLVDRVGRADTSAGKRAGDAAAAGTAGGSAGAARGQRIDACLGQRGQAHVVLGRDHGVVDAGPGGLSPVLTDVVHDHRHADGHGDVAAGARILQAERQCDRARHADDVGAIGGRQRDRTVRADDVFRQPAARGDGAFDVVVDLVDRRRARPGDGAGGAGAAGRGGRDADAEGRDVGLLIGVKQDAALCVDDRAVDGRFDRVVGLVDRDPDADGQRPGAAALLGRGGVGDRHAEAVGPQQRREVVRGQSDRPATVHIAAGADAGLDNRGHDVGRKGARRCAG